MSKIVLISVDRIGKSMAGPGIRYWELATSLARRHQVTLLAPGPVDLQPDGFTVGRYTHRLGGSVTGQHDAVVCQRVTPAVVALARSTGARLVYDAYDPVLLENLELQRGEPIRRRRAIMTSLRADIVYALQHADAITCASEKQRDLWIGAAMALGMLTPDRYDSDPTLRSYIDVVPFGMQRDEPQAVGTGPRALFGFDPDDRVLLWGGGIWDWFDPLTPIRAVAQLREVTPAVRLVFMGTRHPNPALGEMRMAATARALAEDLGVLDSRVHFHDGWVPYSERATWFLEADAGVSAHFDHLETRFSFRTRMLDYLWAGLPIICTEGDSFADLVADLGLGAVVPYTDVEAFTAAVTAVLDVSRRQVIDGAIRDARATMTWDACVSALERIADQAHPARSRRTGAPMYWARRTGTAVIRDGLTATAQRVLRLPR